MDVQGSPRHDESARPTIRRESGALLCILLFLGRIWESRSLGVYGPRYRCNALTTSRLLRFAREADHLLLGQSLAAYFL